MLDLRGNLLMDLGFRSGSNGTHAARTMMLEDLVTLLGCVNHDAAKDAYRAAVLEENLLGKPTLKSRELAWRHLAALYAFDLTNPLFRTLRRLWSLDRSAQPLLALSVALARDPLLRSSQSFVTSLSLGEHLTRSSMEAFLEQTYSGRFSSASLKSFAQNISGTWTAAGVLQGRSHKTRARPKAHPESVTLLLFLSYLEGLSGHRLFSSNWVKLLGMSNEELEVLATAASHRGLLVFMNAGGVKEVRFPGYLTPEEEKIRQEVSHVV